jgi:hypothetical protein
MEAEQANLFCDILRMLFPIDEKIRIRGNNRICYYEHEEEGKEVDIYYILKKGCKTKTKIIPELNDKLTPPTLTLYVPIIHPLLLSIRADASNFKDESERHIEFDIEIHSEKKFYIYTMGIQDAPSNRFLDELIIDKIERVVIKPNEANEYIDISNEKLRRLEHNIRLWKIKSIKGEVDIKNYI